MEVYPKLPLFCGSFLLLFSWKSGSFVEVLWLWNLNKTATTVTFEMAHFDWTRFSLPFAGRSDFECCINHIYVQMLIVLFAKTYFRTWLWETFSWSLIDKHLKSWQFAFLPTSTGLSQTWLFLNLYFPTGFCENSCGVLLRNIVALDSFWHSIPVDLHKHDGLIVNQYLFSNCILEK